MPWMPQKFIGTGWWIRALQCLNPKKKDLASELKSPPPPPAIPCPCFSWEITDSLRMKATSKEAMLLK